MLTTTHTYKQYIANNNSNEAQSTHRQGREHGPNAPRRRQLVRGLRGNYLSNTTCLKHDFFISGEECGRLW